MDDRAGLYAAVSGVVFLFVLVQLGALALVEPVIDTGQQAVEDPENPTNTFVFFGFILAATVVMLGLIKYGREGVIRLFVLAASAGLAAYVSALLLTRASTVGTGIGTLDGIIGGAAVVVPVIAFIVVLAALLYHPEWYVIDAVGVLMGAGAAGLFGASFSPFPAILFLLVLAVYDAISVYGTKHMLTHADGVMDLNVPVLLVVPTTRSYSFQSGNGPETLDADAEADETTDEIREEDAVEDGTESDHTAGSEHDDESEPDVDPSRRDALFVGLGDAVMPTILVASAAAFHPEVMPINLPGIALTVPALGAMVGTILGLLGLLWLVLKGRAHAGLPLLNGGAIAGYLIGATAAGLSLVEAIGLPV